MVGESLVIPCYTILPMFQCWSITGGVSYRDIINLKQKKYLDNASFIELKLFTNLNFETCRY